MGKPTFEPELEDCECSDKAWVWDDEEDYWICENCGVTE